MIEPGKTEEIIGRMIREVNDKRGMIQPGKAYEYRSYDIHSPGRKALLSSLEPNNFRQATSKHSWQPDKTELLINWSCSMMQPGENRRNHRQNDLVPARLKTVQPIILSLHALFLIFHWQNSFFPSKHALFLIFQISKHIYHCNPPKCESLCGLQQRFNKWAIMQFRSCDLDKKNWDRSCTHIRFRRRIGGMW